VKLRWELKARTDELEKPIANSSVEIGKLNARIVELEKNKTVTAKLESENAEFRDRITKVEQRQMLNDPKGNNSSNNSSSNFNSVADQLPMVTVQYLPTLNYRRKKKWINSWTRHIRKTLVMG
jgi:hypothetical protein